MLSPPATSPPDSAYEQALAYLFGRIDFERSATVPYQTRCFRLERMRSLLRLLGDPQTKLPIVHVAGTKGKGSTSTMIASMLSAAGYRTGLYTSPHLERLEERMVIDGALPTPGELVRLVDLCRPAIEELDRQASQVAGEYGPTYFEITTAMALLHFARQRCDIMVLEVGLGGRLDSTNVCLPLVSVITSISFDHTRQLGNTLAAIAGEKAGIIKAGVPVVSGVLPDEPREVIEQIARQHGSRLVQLGRDFEFEYFPSSAPETTGGCGAVNFRQQANHAEMKFEALPLGMLGRHQAHNAAVALATIGELRPHGFDVHEGAIRRGLAHARSPARVEVIAQRPAVVVDAGHNVASIEALIETLREAFPSASRRVLVFGTTREKDDRGMLRLLLPEFDEVILTRYLKNPRSVEPSHLAELCAELLAEQTTNNGEANRPQIVLLPDPHSAWQRVRETTDAGALICVTGSFFLAAEMRVLWQEANSKAVFTSPNRKRGAAP